MKDLRATRTHGPPTQSRIDRIEEQTAKFIRDLNARNNSGGQFTERRASSNIAVRPWDLVLANPSGGAFQVLLPDPKTCLGASVTVKNVTSSVNQITVAALNSTVDGFAVAMNTAYAQRTFRATFDGWWGT